MPLEDPVDSGLVSKLLHPLLGAPVCFELLAVREQGLAWTGPLGAG